MATSVSRQVIFVKRKKGSPSRRPPSTKPGADDILVGEAARPAALMLARLQAIVELPLPWWRENWRPLGLALAIVAALGTAVYFIAGSKSWPERGSAYKLADMPNSPARRGKSNSGQSNSSYPGTSPAGGTTNRQLSSDEGFMAAANVRHKAKNGIAHAADSAAQPDRSVQTLGRGVYYSRGECLIAPGPGEIITAADVGSCLRHSPKD